MQQSKCFRRFVGLFVPTLESQSGVKPLESMCLLAPILARDFFPTSAPLPGTLDVLDLIPGFLGSVLSTRGVLKDSQIPIMM